MTATTQTADTIIAGRKVADYQKIRTYPGHSHTTDMIVGYVVRETIRDGVVLWHGEHIGPSDMHEFYGYDVHVVEGACRYGDTFETRDAYRRQPGGYAVVDTLYSCGCRS